MNVSHDGMLLSYRMLPIPLTRHLQFWDFCRSRSFHSEPFGWGLYDIPKYHNYSTTISPFGAFFHCRFRSLHGGGFRHDKLPPFRWGHVTQEHSTGLEPLVRFQSHPSQSRRGALVNCSISAETKHSSLYPSNTASSSAIARNHMS
jgi:hypothetical protein